MVNYFNQSKKVSMRKKKKSFNIKKSFKWRQLNVLMSHSRLTLDQSYKLLGLFWYNKLVRLRWTRIYIAWLTMYVIRFICCGWNALAYCVKYVVKTHYLIVQKILLWNALAYCEKGFNYKSRNVLKHLIGRM